MDLQCPVCQRFRCECPLVKGGQGTYPESVQEIGLLATFAILGCVCGLPLAILIIVGTLLFRGGAQ